MNQESEWLFETPFPSKEAFEGHSYSNQEDESEWLFEAPYSNSEYGSNFDQESPLLEGEYMLGRSPVRPGASAARGRSPVRPGASAARGRSPARPGASARRSPARPGAPAASKQGEHIFNALGDLANEFVDVLTKRINKNGSAGNRITAVEFIRQLRGHAEYLIQQRNHQDFRTGPQGDKANDQRYSEFSKKTRTAINDLLDKTPSRHTQGYTNLNRLLDNIDHYTIDQKARQSARDALPTHRRQQFDTWYNQTRSLMHITFKTLRDAALAVNRTNLG